MDSLFDIQGNSLHIFTLHDMVLIVINNVTDETLKDIELVVKSVKYRTTRAITLVDPFFSEPELSIATYFIS